jgi:hypothetical protein
MTMTIIRVILATAVVPEAPALVREVRVDLQ